MDNIDKINRLYYYINNLYQDLCNLEINNKCNSVYYNKLVRDLKIKIMVEKMLCDDLIKELSDGEYDELYIKLEDGGSFFGERLLDYLKFHNDEDYQVYEEDDDETIENINYLKLLSICYVNIYLVYLSYLVEHINAYSFNKLRENLISFKYYNSFKNHDIEKILIDNNFDINKTNYVNIYFMADIINLDQELRENIIFSCYFDVICTTISQMLSINDNEYNDDKRLSVLINNQCMFRAVLSVMGEYEYNKIKNDIFELINDNSNDKNSMSVMIINSILDRRKKDKCRVRKISVRPLDS